MEGIITKGTGGLYTVDCDGDKLFCKARGIFRKEKITPLTGDYVTVEDGVITEIHERRNSLIRPACANIDKLFIVSALSSPEPNLLNLDKMITIAVYHNIEPIIVFGKTDLNDALGIRDIYRKLPIKCFEICGITGEGDLDRIKSEISGCTVALSGLSGVGKSSLMNLLDASVHAETGTVGKNLRGRHTTRCVELFDLCGGRIMDTPGFSSLLFEYFDIVDRSKLAACFPEFDGYIGKCRFDDCAHIAEPGCAVLEAVKNGEIPTSRHESYTAVYNELGVYKRWEQTK